MLLLRFNPYLGQSDYPVRQAVAMHCRDSGVG